MPFAPPVRPVGRALLFLAVCAPVCLAPGFVSMVHPAVMAAALLGVTWGFLRWDGRSLSALGIGPPGSALGHLLLGVGLGALLIGVVALGTAVALPFPWARNPRFDPAAAAVGALWLLCGNAAEELIFRGYSFERLIVGIGHWRAQLLTALWFAVFHVAQGWTWQTALVFTTTGSLLFGLVFVRWHSLPAAVGVHAAANWTRDLLLLDPPTNRTLLAPLAPRPWTSAEQLATGMVFTSVVLIACLILWRSIARQATSQGWLHKRGATTRPRA